MWTFQTESRKKARKLIVERLMGSSPVWLYDEPDVPTYLSDRERLVRMKRIRMYGSALTRRWMDVLGVKEHYVSFTGTKEILL